MGGELAAVAWRPARARDRAAPCARACDAACIAAGVVLLRDAAHRRDEAVAGELAPPAARRRRLPSRMTTMRSAVSRISPRRCEIRMHAPPPATKRRTKASSWPASTRVERRGRLVEDDERDRRVGDREGAGDLDHLAAADRQVADHVAGAMPWPGKISSSLSRISAPERRRQPKPLQRGWKTRAFSATVRLGQSDSSWNTQRMPWRWAAATS